MSILQVGQFMFTFANAFFNQNMNPINAPFNVGRRASSIPFLIYYVHRAYLLSVIIHWINVLSVTFTGPQVLGAVMMKEREQQKL